MRYPIFYVYLAIITWVHYILVYTAFKLSLFLPTYISCCFFPVIINTRIIERMNVCAYIAIWWIMVSYCRKILIPTQFSKYKYLLCSVFIELGMDKAMPREKNNNNERRRFNRLNKALQESLSCTFRWFKCACLQS